MAKIDLYIFGLSVWAAAPQLAVEELGYSDEVELKVVNLVEAENFSPEFLKLNPAGTLPTLVADEKAYTNTTDVIEYLVKHAPKKVALRTKVTEIVHEDKIDPNFPMLAVRNEEELQAKANGFPKTFVSNRQEALNKHSESEAASEHKEFYTDKLSSNGGLLAIYSGQVSQEVKDGFFAKSQQHWNDIGHYIVDVLPASLPDTGFFGGETPGEDDFHVAAWLARITSLSDATDVAGVEKEIGKPVPKKVQAYWQAWAARESFKKVYADGLH